MTNPCYDFALRPRTNIPNSSREPRHTSQRSNSPTTPSSQESADDEEVEFSQHRSDRGRWKTDERVNIAGEFEVSNSQCCQCHHCVSIRERNSCDYSDQPRSRHASSGQRPSSSGNAANHQPGSKKHPPTLPKFDHSSWSPLQLLRRPFTSSEGGSRSRIDESSSKSRSPSHLRSDTTPSRNRDVRESSSPNRVAHRISSKVRSLRKNPNPFSQQRKQSPRKSSPGRTTSSRVHTPSLERSSSRRKSYVDSATSPCKEKCDIGCQTRQEEFPFLPEETPRASHVRRVIASNAFYHDLQKPRPQSSSGQRRPSPFKCGTTSCGSTSAPAATRECCCSVCVAGWQEKAQHQKHVGLGSVASCQHCRPGNCYTDFGCHHQGGCSHHQGGFSHYQGCHQDGNHPGQCYRAEPSVRHCECSKCHPPRSK